MSQNNNCSVCSRNLGKGGVWCKTCLTWMHIKCSGLPNGRAWHADWACITCTSSPRPMSNESPSDPAPSNFTEPARSAQPDPNQNFLTEPTLNQQNTPTIEDVEAKPEAFWQNIEGKRPLLKKVYDQIVHWKPIFFILSKNKVGFTYVESLNVLLTPLANNSLNSDVAFYAAFVFPHLVLPKTKREVDGSISKIIGRRLKQWNAGQIEELFEEAKAIQMRLVKNNKRKDEKEAKIFNKNMEKGKISSAIRCLTEETGGVLSLSERIDGETVEAILQRKHPKGQPANDDLIAPKDEQTLPYHSAIFDQINSARIRKAAMKTHGSHGPSGQDADEWRRLLTHFNQPSVELAKTIAKIAQRLATSVVPAEDLEAYNACRLIPLDKKPGVRPIGIGEVIRRIIGKSITQCIKTDLKRLGANFQLCLGQKCGIEYAIHTLREAYLNNENQAILLIDAENAFNSLNRELALRNVENLCPSLLNAIKNSYSTPSKLYVNNKTLWSREGTTQGDPLAMAMYGVAIIPLIRKLDQKEIMQKWFADDGNAVGSLQNLRKMLDLVETTGQGFGYFVKPSKCHLICKPEYAEEAKKIFHGTNIKIVEGHRILGSAIGTAHATKTFINEQEELHLSLINKLADIAKTHPQNVYACYTKGVQAKLSFLSRTTPSMSDALNETEKAVRHNLLPKMLRMDSISDDTRTLISLPLKLGGLNISEPIDQAASYKWSQKISCCLETPETALDHQSKIAQSCKKEKQQEVDKKREELLKQLGEQKRYAVLLASEKGASNWLNVLPLKKYNFNLTKSEFRDGIHLRYGWDPPNLPQRCACGAQFDITHALHCAKGGFTHQRHNEIRDTFARFMDEVCHDVEIEPHLQSLQSESFDNRSTTTEDDARLDIKANGLWGSRFTRTFFDVKIFNPHAKSCPKTLKDAYSYHESLKKLKYEQRINDVEHSSFVPLIFACTGGAGPKATKTIQKLAEKISEKRNDTYQETINYLRTTISLALLRSAILCIRGCRSLKRPFVVDNSIGAIVEEGCIS